MGSRLSLLIDDKLIKIIRLFLTNDSGIFHLQSISKESGVSIATTHRMIKKLVDVGLVNQVIVGKTKVYHTNKELKQDFMILLGE